jgi:hypothetical protein
MISHRPFAVGLAVLAASCAAIAFAAGVLLTPGIVEDVSRNYNEGWMVEIATRFLAGESLYARTDSIVSANYPPLWYFLLAFAGTAGLEMNVVGRMIELSSLPACAVLVALISHRLGALPPVAVAAGITCLGLTLSWLPGYIGINDPHLTGQAIMLAGAWLALQRTPKSLWLGGLLCAAAGFTKQSLLPIPVSLAAYLLLVDRRAFIHFALALISVTAVGLIVCTVAWGADFWNGIAPDRAHPLWSLRLHVERNVPLYLAMVAVGTVGVMLVRTERRLVWPLAYLTVAAAVGFYAQTVPGVSLNHQYDVLIAMTLVLAVASGEPLLRLTQTRFWSWIALVACMVVLLANTYDNAQWTLDSIAQRHLRNQQAHGVITTIAGYSGRVACEDAILCVRAGKFSALDFYNAGQAIETGALDADDVVQLLISAGVQAVQFRGEPGQAGRLPDNVVMALLEVYPQVHLRTDLYTLVQRSCAPNSECQITDSKRLGPSRSFGPDG